MACNCVQGDLVGNGMDVYNIPVKLGEPLSPACLRDTVSGSIPRVLNYPGFTLVEGEPVVGIPTNGGIANMACFFTTREGCYYANSARAFGSTCA